MKSLYAVCTICATTAVYAADPLILECEFEEPAGNAINDSSPAHNPAGSIVNAERCEGKTGRALRLNGLNSCAVMPKLKKSISLEEMTLDLYFKPEKLGGAQYIMGGVGAPSFFVRTVENILQTGILVPDVAWREIHLETPLRNGEWYHFVLTLNKNTAVCYLNGAKAGEVAITGVALTNDMTIYAGRASTVGEPFYGIVDSIRLYNKILPPEEANKK